MMEVTVTDKMKKYFNDNEIDFAFRQEHIKSNLSDGISTILPCPFCGEVGSFVLRGDALGFHFMCRVKGCEAVPPMCKSVDKAIDQVFELAVFTAGEDATWSHGCKPQRAGRYEVTSIDDKHERFVDLDSYDRIHWRDNRNVDNRKIIAYRAYNPKPCNVVQVSLDAPAKAMAASVKALTAEQREAFGEENVKGLMEILGRCMVGGDNG